MTNTKYIAFLDILGFKDLIENNKIEVVEKLYDTFQNGLVKSFAFTNLQGSRTENDKFKEYADIEKTILNSLIISDSIIIWTDDDDYKNFLELVLAVKFFMYLSIGSGLPLRGAISCGELSIKNGKHKESPKFNSYTTILGLALTRAYVLESKSEWSGCVIDEKCAELFQNKVETKSENVITLSSLEKFDILRKYKVPLKSGEVKEYYTVNWTHFNGPRITPKKLLESFKSHNKKINDWSVQHKIQNTLKYLSDTQKYYKIMQKLLED